MTEIVTIVRGVVDGEDEMGNPTVETVEIPVPGCAFAPGASAESVATFGARSDTDGTVYAPREAVFLSSDMVRIRGVLYTVDGDPQEWTSPFTNEAAGVVLNVKRGS